MIDVLSGLTPREARRRLFDACAVAAEQSRDHLQAAHPGRLWESLQHEKLSVLWLFDEIDKVSKTAK